MEHNSRQTLRDLPNWRYLLQEYDELYRYLPAGGSDRIRGHQRKVREAISRLIKKNGGIKLQPFCAARLTGRPHPSAVAPPRG